MPDFEPVLLRRVLRNASPWLDGCRGGGGFPTGLKWTFLPKDHPGPIYMCINADESEPCTFNNRILMEQDPHQVLEGILIACYAIKASRAFYYVRYEYGTPT